MKNIVKRTLDPPKVGFKKVGNKLISEGAIITLIDLDVFKWDGSSLGELSDENIKEKQIKEKQHLWTLTIGGHEAIGYVRTSTTIHSCIIDELKPIFGLNKLNTHWFYHKKKIHIFIKYYPDDKKLDELSVKNINPNLIKQVQAIFIFREILGIKSTNEGNIILRDELLISTNEKKITVDEKKENAIIKDKDYRKWFTTTKEFNLSLRRLLKVHIKSDLVGRYMYYSDKINEVISRVDIKYAYLTKIILIRTVDLISLNADYTIPL